MTPTEIAKVVRERTGCSFQDAHLTVLAILSERGPEFAASRYLPGDGMREYAIVDLAVQMLERPGFDAKYNFLIAQIDVLDRRVDALEKALGKLKEVDDEERP